jgi:hypothetical protein
VDEALSQVYPNNFPVSQNMQKDKRQEEIG